MKLLLRFSTVLIICLIAISSSIAIENDTIDLVKAAEKLDRYMKFFSGENPGAVVSVMKKGDIVYKRSFGLANVETKQVMNEELVFNIANISKSFTSLAVMKLIEKGKLNLDNNLVDIFSDFPEYGAKVKVKHLLNHRSGIVAYDTEGFKTNDDVLDFLKEQEKTHFEPGTEFKYSNSEYALLAIIIEKVSGLSYQEYLNKVIFKKLKISNAFVSPTNEKAVNLATGHFKINGKYNANMQYSSIYGEQGVFMSIESFSKWDKALYSNKLLACESLSKIFSLNEVDDKKPSYYGYGWVLMERNETRYYWHGGTSTGYTTMVLHLPDTDMTVLILTNRNDGYDFLKMSIRIAKFFNKDLKL